MVLIIGLLIVYTKGPIPDCLNILITIFGSEMRYIGIGGKLNNVVISKSILIENGFSAFWNQALHIHILDKWGNLFLK